MKTYTICGYLEPAITQRGRKKVLVPENNLKLSRTNIAHIELKF